MLRLYVELNGRRNLLSHSSGFRYVPIDPLLIKWREIHGEKELEPGGPFNNRFLLPLTAEPDTRWAYAFGLDWAGRVVETLTGGTLHDWVVEHIAKPLGSDSMTFFPQQRLDLLKRRADYAKAPDSTTSFPSQRPPEGGQAAPVHSEDGRFILANAQYHEKDAEDCFGGYGLWASAQDLFEVCRSLLLKDGRLLKAETIDEGLKPQLTKSAEEAMAEALKNTMHDDWGMGAGFQHHSKRSASLFGMRLQEENERTPRKEGTVAWVGYPNVFYVHRLLNFCPRPRADRRSSLTRRPACAECLRRRSYRRATPRRSSCISHGREPFTRSTSVWSGKRGIEPSAVRRAVDAENL